MIAIIGAVGRLTDAGMSVDDATDTVLRIMRESEPGGRPRPIPERRLTARDDVKHS
jgi:hypothetical protein